MKARQIDLTNLTFSAINVDNAPEVACYYFTVEAVLREIKNIKGDYSTDAARFYCIHKYLKEYVKEMDYSVLKAADEIVMELRNDAPIQLIAKFKNFKFTVHSKSHFSKIIKLYEESLKKT